jgi:SAM-dependent methyltransferase
VQGNAESLPFETARFDAYTIAFGIRNVPRIDLALKEAFRVLRRGGRLLVLEFSKVHIPGLDTLYDNYSFHVVPHMGRLIAGDAAPYQYLVESIRQFPAPDDFAAMISEAGFRRVDYTPMSGGIVPNLDQGQPLGDPELGFGDASLDLLATGPRREGGLCRWAWGLPAAGVGAFGRLLLLAVAPDRLAICIFCWRGVTQFFHCIGALRMFPAVAIFCGDAIHGLPSGCRQV